MLISPLAGPRLTDVLALDAPAWFLRLFRPGMARQDRRGCSSTQDYSSRANGGLDELLLLFQKFWHRRSPMCSVCRMFHARIQRWSLVIQCVARSVQFTTQRRVALAGIAHSDRTGAEPPRCRKPQAAIRHKSGQALFAAHIKRLPRPVPADLRRRGGPAHRHCGSPGLQ